MTAPPKPHVFCKDTTLESNIICSNIQVSIIKIFATIGIPTYRAKAWREGSIIAKKALAEGNLDSYLLENLPKDHIYKKSLDLCILGQCYFFLFKKKHYRYYDSLLTSIYDAFCIEYNILPEYKKPYNMRFNYMNTEFKIIRTSRNLARHHFVSKFEEDENFRLMR